MPRAKRGSGFTRVKRGRGKNERGHARGGRPRKTSQDCIGVWDLDIDSQPDTATESESESVESASFRHCASGVSDHSDSEGNSSTTDWELESSRPTTPAAEDKIEVRSISPQFSAAGPSNLKASQITVATRTELINLLRAVLPKEWLPVVEPNGVHIVLLSRGNDKAIQRSVFMNFDGRVRVTAHRRCLPLLLHESIVAAGGESVVMSDSTVRAFVDRGHAIVLFVRRFEICAGADYKEYENQWKSDNSGFIDLNCFDECRYEKTFRSHTCDMLLPVEKWRCKQCIRVGVRFRSRKMCNVGLDFNVATPNIFLTEEQKLKKMQDLQRLNKNKDRKINYYQKRVALLLEMGGVPLDHDLSASLQETLASAKLTPLQALFIQQQQKAASCKSASGMRWHPTMIRLALLIKSEAGCVLDTLRCAGLRFPSDRTLFDYSHAVPTTEGVMLSKLDKISEKIEQYESYRQFHNLLMDEIHISQKLVYQKSTGNMVGYVKLNEVEEEIMMLTKKINSEDKIDEPPIAKTMYTYMVKGVCNDVKEVIASYSASAPNAEFLYDRTWNVISKCEVAGVKILSIVGDGASVNRTFYKMHKPATVTKSGVVFDTRNLCAPDRLIYFISDPPHLLKTIRNCFAKSGVHPKAKRLLTKNNETIVWSTIIRLFLEDHENTWRQNCKLNSVNVYLNSYSCMKVLYAAQVMSRTTQMDLQSRKWKGTAETVKFIQLVNDFFDCLNGAHSLHGKRTANPRLEPYTNPEDRRFDELAQFLEYLEEWSFEVNEKPRLKLKEKERMMLAKATLEGIEITVKSFTGAVKYMLSQQKARFINARVFNQDPLEQYFGKQRASLGGKHNPNAQEFLFSDIKISTHRDLNVRRRSGNTEAVNRLMEVSKEPLPKRGKNQVFHK